MGPFDGGNKCPGDAEYYRRCASRGLAGFFIETDRVENKFLAANAELAEYERTIIAERGSSIVKDAIDPQCDIYTLMVFRLTGGDVVKMQQVWKMLEEEVYEVVYLRRAEYLNYEYSKL
jgi:hypothetical protein